MDQEPAAGSAAGDNRRNSAVGSKLGVFGEDDSQSFEDEGGSIGFMIGTEAAQEASTGCYQPFENSMIPLGLSQLGRTASGNHTSYLRIELTGTTLDDPQAIALCQHLQHVVLAHNSLTTLRALGQWQQLITLDVSHNQLTQVLDFSPSGSDGSKAFSTNLRSVDLSFNLISHIRDLSAFSKLSRLVLDGNQIEYVGSGLKHLPVLHQLSLSGNRLRSCAGLEGLTSLRELALDGNQLISTASLQGPSNLEVLLLANNQLTTCQGLQGLGSLRRLDVSGNLLRRLEVLSPCCGLQLLAELDVSANPLEGSQDVQLCLVHLLPQVSILNGAAVSSADKVEAANMAGAAAEGLLAIRRRYFPNGELDDGGGAVPPTAAGLTPSRAEEEKSSADPQAMFAAIDDWARAVQLETALAAAGAAASMGSVFSSSIASGTGARCAVESYAGNAPAAARAAGDAHSLNSAGGAAALAVSTSQVPEYSAAVAAVAASLAAGCSKEAPWSQLQLARACYTWVLHHVQLPVGCDAGAGADLVTWDVGLHLFLEEQQQIALHQALLPGQEGTWAQCVSQLLVQLVKACHMEAVLLNGFWKAGGLGSVAPGDRLAAHNHSWVAVKVNGRWRLLDPVYAIIRNAQLPFYLPPEAFIHSHLPFEAYWQLLPEPVSHRDWWQAPEVSLAFCAAGGQLISRGLKACNILQPVRPGQSLPSLNIQVAGPADQHQHIRLKLLDENRQMLAAWQHQQLNLSNSLSSKSNHRTPSANTASAVHQQAADEAHLHIQQLAQPTQQPQQQQRQQRQQHLQQQGQDLVYQQPVLCTGGAKIVTVGNLDRLVAVQDMWVSLPGPGTYYLQVEHVVEQPGFMQLNITGLPRPMQLTYRQTEDVIRAKVVAPPTADSLAQYPDPDGVNCNIPVALLPRPEAGFCQLGGFQLLSPLPCKVLESDRPEQFEVIVPNAAAVAVGTDETGWVELTPVAAADSAAAAAAVSKAFAAAVDGAAAGFSSAAAVPAGGGKAAADSISASRGSSRGNSASSSQQPRPQQQQQLRGLFIATVVLPRAARCFVAARFGGGQQQQHRPQGQQSGGSWLPVVSLRLVPQVQHLVVVPDLHPVPEPDHTHPLMPRVRKMLAGLDVDQDGVVSRRDMLMAFRKDRQLADHLKMPPRVKVGDGSFDKFLTKFSVINSDGLGYVDLKQLWAYMAVSSDDSVAQGGGSRVSTAASGADGGRLRGPSARSEVSRCSTASRMTARTTGGGAGGLRRNIVLGMPPTAAAAAAANIITAAVKGAS